VFTIRGAGSPTATVTSPLLLNCNVVGATSNSVEHQGQRQGKKRRREKHHRYSPDLQGVSPSKEHKRKRKRKSLDMENPNEQEAPRIRIKVLLKSFLRNWISQEHEYHVYVFRPDWQWGPWSACEVWELLCHTILFGSGITWQHSVATEETTMNMYNCKLFIHWFHEGTLSVAFKRSQVHITICKWVFDLVYHTDCPKEICLNISLWHDKDYDWKHTLKCSVHLPSQGAPSEGRKKNCCRPFGESYR
jgi:hypothetical protein